jgi:hypothetical protein
MDAAALNAWMDEHLTRSAFRLETLQSYEVASDGSDHRRYLDGEPTWTPERKQPWLDHLRAERERGVYRHRVRLVTRPVTLYTRYECEWGYAPNVAAGEDVRVLDLGEQPVPDELAAADWWRFDWWLVESADDERRVVGMTYEPDGRFRDAWFADAGTRPAAAFVAVRDRLWTAAEPFDSWWGTHTELHRDGVHPG